MKRKRKERSEYGSRGKYCMNGENKEEKKEL